MNIKNHLVINLTEEESNVLGKFFQEISEVVDDASILWEILDSIQRNKAVVVSCPNNEIEINYIPKLERDDIK